MRKITIIISVIALICLSLIMGCNRYDPWEKFETDIQLSDDVAISADLEGLSKGEDKIVVNLMNQSDYVIEYFSETVRVQKKVGNDWYTYALNDDKSGLPGAEIPHECHPKGEDALEVPLKQLLPSSPENGEYRLYLPYRIIKDENSSEMAYTVFSFNY